ncbi:MAG: hypothetical protein L3K11_03505, partial [Thermoplasmata archaeon]|nr:hypothetical protein [Thermoplasmata archaeon]
YFVYCQVSITNLSFLSWTGLGNGSVTSSQANITVTPYGPVTETGNFYNTAGCSGYLEHISPSYNYGSIVCGNVTTTLSVDEHGLPTGTDWGVGITGPSGSTAAQQSTTSSVTFLGVDVATYYAVNAWTIPTANPGLFWVPSVSVGAGLVPPIFVPIQVNYTLESLTGLSFGVDVQEQGLPTGTDWSYTVGTSGVNTTYGSHTTSNLLSLAANDSYTVAAGFVAGTTGEGFEVTGASYFVDTVNGTAFENVSVNASFTLTGYTNITFWYSQAWWVTVLAGSNGTVTPGNSWVLNASGLVISASPSAGFIFVGWSGSGAGATGPAQRHLATTIIHPTGPVIEIASFAPRPPPTWKLTVSANGIPGTQPYTVDLGGASYTGSGTFVIGNLSTNTYTLGAPDIFDNATAGVRYVPGAANSSLSLTGNQLTIDANGTLTVPFTTQFLLSVTGTSGGTVSPAGNSWETSGTQVALTATVAHGYSFSGWNGTGLGARTSKNPTITVVVGGVIAETAQFTAIPAPPPATYTLSVSESGLPTTANWNLGVGTTGASGTGPLTVGGLNGTYALTVPVVYTTAGTRYVPNGTVGYSQMISVKSQNATWSVSFTEQVLVTLQSSGQGTVTGSSGWVAANTPIALTAAAASGWQFAGWSGTGAGSTTTNASSSTTITPTGPVVETATFTPMQPAKTTTGSSSAGMITALGLLVALLVVGAVVGLLLARRRRRSPPPAEPMESWQEAPTDTENPPVDTGGAPPGTS